VSCTLKVNMRMGTFCFWGVGGGGGGGDYYLSFYSCSEGLLSLVSIAC
jgi:hypothetical protein